MTPLSILRQCVKIQCDIIQNGFIRLRRPRVDQLMQLNVTNLHKACVNVSHRNDATMSVTTSQDVLI